PDGDADPVVDRCMVLFWNIVYRLWHILYFSADMPSAGGYPGSKGGWGTMRVSVVARWRAVVAVGAAGVVAAGLTGAGTAGADAIRFSASATADGGRLAFVVPGASVSDQIIDGGGPVAQADLDSLGSSRAFASTPYPGELGVIGPGIVASLINAPQPPPYPFIAQSRHPSTPEQHVEYGQFFRLQARSEETSSSATA